MSPIQRSTLCYWLFCLVLTAGSLNAAETTSQDYLKRWVDQLTIGESLRLGGEPIIASGVIAKFYETRDFEVAWTNTTQVAELLDTLENADQHGLLPQDYHVDEIRRLQQTNPQSDADRAYTIAKMDMLLTDATLLLGFHRIKGKVDPASLEDSWNYSRPNLVKGNVIETLNRHLEQGTVVDGLDSLLPKTALYESFRKALTFYDDLHESGKFVTLSAERTLKKGGDGADVEMLRKRLQVEGYGGATNEDKALFGDTLEAAVKRFQDAHSIEADGVVGPRSFAALNVSFSERADQIRLNMERTRWVMDEVDDNFVLVNLAGFKLYFLKDRAVTWQTDVMIGTINRETPIFRSNISYLVFNPTWTVPRGILGRSVLPSFKSDPDSIKRNHYVLYDRSGKEVDPMSIDWPNATIRNFNYTVVQQPSDTNAMGLVKFMFPNQYQVYLHDTPARSLFSRSERAFSNGCVRVDQPFELARLLLDDEEQWSAEKIQDVLDTKQLRNVTLDPHVKVMLMYWTVEPLQEGGVRFNNDIYQRDAALRKALFKPINP